MQKNCGKETAENRKTVPEEFERTTGVSAGVKCMRIWNCADGMYRTFRGLGLSKRELEKLLARAVTAADKLYTPEQGPYGAYLGNVLASAGLKILRMQSERAEEAGAGCRFTKKQVDAWLDKTARPHVLSGKAYGAGEDVPFDYGEWGISERVQRAICNLNEEEREICKMLIRGLSVDEIASELHMRKEDFRGTVWSRLCARLRCAMGGGTACRSDK